MVLVVTISTVITRIVMDSDMVWDMADIMVDIMVDIMEADGHTIASATEEKTTLLTEGMKEQATCPQDITRQPVLQGPAGGILIFRMVQAQAQLFQEELVLQLRQALLQPLRREGIITL
jgi:hypothetical protein